MEALSRLLDRVPLAFYAGVVTGALLAAAAFVGTLFSWACWIITQIGG